MPERLNGAGSDDRDRPEGEPSPEDHLDASFPRITGQPSVQHGDGSVTTGALPDEEVASPHPRPVRTPVGRWVGLFAVGWLVAGVVAGFVWHALVPLTIYEVTDDRGSFATERGLAAFIAADAWFVIIGIVLGALCGLISWRWFAGLGWPIVPLAIVGSAVMGLVCWGVGSWLGPSPLDPRLVNAIPGQTLPIELTVRAPAALLAWPLAAVLVIMLISAVAPDPEDASL